MFSFWRSKPKDSDFCKSHQQPVERVCIKKNCIYPRFICSIPQCRQNHLQHQTSSYTEYNERLSKLKQQISNRQAIADIVDGYYSKTQMDIDRWAETEKIAFMDDMQRKYFTKRLMLIEGKLAEGEDFIPQLFQLSQQNTKPLIEMTTTKIKEFQKVFSQHINKQMRNLSSQILVPLDRGILGDKAARLERLVELLPFTCKLNLKFVASMHGFVTKDLYALKIKGPVIILVESKRKLFGGFTPNMFSERDEYIQDTRAEGFLFSIDEMRRLPIKPEYRRYAVRGGSVWGFGRGDLCVSEECHKACISWAEIGRVYEKPSGIKGDQKQFLGGAWYFRVVEYQVYQVEGMKKKN